MATPALTGPAAAVTPASTRPRQPQILEGIRRSLLAPDQQQLITLVQERLARL